MKKNKISTPNIIALTSKETEELKTLVKQNLPEFVGMIENKEDVANAMFASGQEMWLAIDDVLTRLHGFDETELTRFHHNMKDILTGVKEFEDANLSIMTTHSMSTVGDLIQQKGITALMAEIAGIRYRKEKINRIGLESAITPEAKPFIKQLIRKK